MFDALLDYIKTHRIFGNLSIIKSGDTSFTTYAYCTTRDGNQHGNCRTSVAVVMGTMQGTILTMTMIYPRKVVIIDFMDPSSFDRLLSYKGLWYVDESNANKNDFTRI